jgi:alanine or glycine:cation symporter, AGCS family
MLITKIEKWLASTVDIVWGLPTIAIMILSGLSLTLYLSNGIPLQIRYFSHALKVVFGKYDNPNDPGEINHFQALCTALSATIGLGNIGIVAIIIKLGGPGAIFWMFIAGFIGMATKYAETTLALAYRHIKDDGSVRGGPMYYIKNGLSANFLPMAKFYSFAIAIGSFGISNMFQTNQSAEILHQSFAIPKMVTGIVFTLLAAVVIIGGIKRIAKVTSILVPLMGITYVIGCLIVLSYHYQVIPDKIMLIINSAFSVQSFAGGTTFGIYMALIQGIKRACFSNEAGLGSAAIAHSAAATKEPAREGMVSMLEPFIDTMTICTMSALVILTTDVWQHSDLMGVPLTALAFDSVIPGFGKYFIPIAATLFAFSTLISWSYYGETAIEFLMGEKYIISYKALFCLFAAVGAIWEVKAVLDFSDIMTGLMIFPNLLAIWLLRKKLKLITINYLKFSTSKLK